MRVGFIGHVGGVHDTGLMSTKGLVSVITENIGNLLFRYAMQRLVKDYVQVDFTMAPEMVREMVDVIVYPTANQINPSLKHLDFHANFFRKIARPLVVVGLGAQYKSSEVKDLALDPSTVRYLKVISEFSTHIGVRGEFSKDILRRLGIDNVVVAGCPSNFFNPAASADLAKTIGDRLRNLKSGDRKITRLACHPQHGSSYYTPEHKQSERMLFDLCRQFRGGTYVVNGPSAAYSAARGRLFENWHAAELRKLHEFIEPEVPYQDFMLGFRSISLSFGSLQSWMEFLSCQDLVIGKRIHGSQAALQLGIPSILLSHDSRTKELAQTLKIPSIDLHHKAVGHAKAPVQALLEAVEFDPAAYARRREQLWTAMSDLLRENGLELTKPQPLSTALV